LAATLTLDYKRIPAAIAFALAASVGFSKWQSKKIEDQEKTTKSEEDRELRNNQEQQLEAIRDEKNAEKLKHRMEIEDLREKYERSTKNMMTAIIEDFHKRYFRREAKLEIHKHRATLFQCVEIADGETRTKRLQIFARAGVHPDSSRSWPVDDNEPGGCRGIAAQIWFHGVGTVKTAACDWPLDGNPVQKATYAESLGISVDEAEALNVKSRVFTGARIMVRGQRWGVLLLDSLKEGHISDSQYEKRLIDEYVDIIGSVLERMKP
jgi:hypothetical protein